MSGRPRYLMVDLDDVEFVGEQQRLPIVPMEAMYNNRRFARDLDNTEEPSFAHPLNAAPVSRKRVDTYQEGPPKGIA